MSHTLYNKNNNIFIEYSAKSNCTVICKMFFDYIGLLDDALKYNPWIHEYENHVYKKINPIPSILPKNILKLKFVRNPYSRAVSSYLHCLKHKLSGQQNESFCEFLSKLKKLPYDIHFAYQCNDSYSENNFDKIIKIENLSNEIIEINNKHNIKLNSNFTSNHFFTKKNNNSCKLFVGDLSFNDIDKFIKNNKLPPYYCFYNDKIKLLVEDYYHNDIINLDYSFYDILYDDINLCLPNDFNTKHYKKLNPDLNNLSDSELKIRFLVDEIINNKINKIPNDFNPNTYKNLNQDLNKMSDEEATLHYENHGFYEKRKYQTLKVNE
jgi:hypothetical protein